MCCPTSGWPIEPDMHLTGPDRIFILAEQTSWRRPVLFTQGSGHHQVVPEIGFRLELQEIRHGLEDATVIALLHPFQAREIGRCMFRAKDMLDTGGLMLAQFLQWPEFMAHGTRSQQDHPTIDLVDGLAQGTADAQEVFGLTGLGATDRYPGLLTALQIGEQIDRRILQRQAGIIDRCDPGAMLAAIAGQSLCENRIARKVIGYL